MEEPNLIDMSSTIFGNKEWKELEDRELAFGADVLLDELIDKAKWSNTEIAWILRRMIYFYGKKDPLLLKAPPERLFTNMVDVLRTFYLIIDLTNPEIDDNMRSYLTTKLADATWGINSRTREYLHKL
ncbi:MAG TPA: hypothetical protein VFC73_04840 [Syntrophomonadaceae bacterium]|nr:hypothetical protein [Syntrophomonadaceae bacterium]